MSGVTRISKKIPGNAAFPAVRVPRDGDPAEIAEALELPPALGVLLLSGGAGLMTEEVMAELRQSFETLARWVATNRITVLDGGTQAGVMRLMGEALAKVGHTAPHIGVLPAHALADESDPHGLTGEDMLEPNHTHFVLVEARQWGDEVDLLIGLAAHLQGSGPGLALLVNGGSVAAADMRAAVAAGFPVLVWGGSGRFADELAEAVTKQDIDMREVVAELAHSGKVKVFQLAQPEDTLTDILIDFIPRE